MGAFSSPQSAANSSSLCRCSAFKRDGTSTSNRTSKSPRSPPFRWMIPLPRSLNICPLWVPAGIFRCALPSSVGTSTCPPNAATENDNLYCEVPIPFSVAALGGQVDVPTLEGKAHLKIPAGTQSGQIFKLRGKGIIHLNGGD